VTSSLSRLDLQHDSSDSLTRTSTDWKTPYPTNSQRLLGTRSTHSGGRHKLMIDDPNRSVSTWQVEGFLLGESKFAACRRANVRKHTSRVRKHLRSASVFSDYMRDNGWI